MSTSENTDFKDKLDQIIQKEWCNVLYECNQQYIAKYAYPKNCAVTESLHEIENVDSESKSLKDVLSVYYNILIKLKLDYAPKTDDPEIREMYFEGLNDIEDIIDKWLICVLK